MLPADGGKLWASSLRITIAFMCHLDCGAAFYQARYIIVGQSKFVNTIRALFSIKLVQAPKKPGQSKDMIKSRIADQQDRLGYH